MLLRYIVGYGTPTAIVAFTLGKNNDKKCKNFSSAKTTFYFSVYIRDSPGSRLPTWNSKKILLAQVK
jgi:hypothetical protein